MAAKFFVILCVCVAATSALPAAVQYEVEAPAHYEFAYSVEDGHTGDVKQQQESRAGDVVQGSYSLIQPDGVRRVVHYSADKEHGFNAQVDYEGHPVEQKVAYAAAPVAYAAPKIAYAAPKIAYAAPRISYAAAPVANYAYAQPLGHVSYSSPAISYQH